MGTKTTCSYCGVGCGIVIEKDTRGRLSLKGDDTHPANKGMLCSKGRNLHYVVQDKSDRILYPHMRKSKNHPLERVSWDHAIQRVSRVFQTMIDKFGPDSVGFYVSGQCLTEEYYLVNKLCKGFIGTNNIDTNSRLCMSSAVAGYKKALGEDAVPVSYDDIELADCFYIAGANPAWCHPILFRRLEQHKEKNPNVKIIVADPRKTQSCEMADLHLQLNPGTDIQLNNAICKYLIENNMVDLDFITSHSNGFHDLAEQLKKADFKDLADQCGIAPGDIEKAAKMIGKSKGLITMWAMGLNQSEQGVDKNLSLINISLITGKIGKPGCGPFSLTGQPNAMGGREVGGMSNLLPAHRDLLNPQHRDEVAKFWKVNSIPDKPGLTATEMFEHMEQDKLKAIWIICTNPLVSLPNARIAEKALKNARFVIVQDISMNSVTLEYADLVLPAAGWLEKEGTMTNSDRRISYLHKALDPPGEALPDCDILIRFAKKMGYKGFDFRNTEDVFNEHCRLTEGTNIDISGLSYDYLKNKGTAQWPFVKNETGETKRLFTDWKFYTPDNKANIHSIVPKTLVTKNENYPLVLTTGRIRDQWHTMTKTGKVQKLNQHINKPFLEINPEDAFERNICDNDTVIVQGEKGDVTVNAIISNEIKKGVVFLPMHWGKILNNDSPRANNLTTGKVDPVSKEPDFKYTPVQVSKYVKSKEKIIIIGAGAAAHKFIETYRELNQTDQILVFSAEKEVFYNRILLPDYINGEKQFNELKKIRKEEQESLNIELFEGNRIIEINKEEKKAIDSYGKVHTYDKLILCTGSSPRIPTSIDRYIPGIFTLRNKDDADDILNHLNNKNVNKILVVGGGLLGLEIASSLIRMNKKLTLVHRNSRLMDKQLDYTAATLLSQQVVDLGIKVNFSDEVEEILLQDDLRLHVVFKSGKKETFEAIVVAIGTKPNIKLAMAADIRTNRAIIVNERLETSNKNIFAIGEVAELNGQTYGITSAAEEQAAVLAKSISGDPNVVYKGSVPMNILKFPGIELCSIGNIKSPDTSDEGYEEVVFSDLSLFYYKKCILKNDRMVGAILMGDKSEFSSFKDLISNNQELAEMRLRLLRSGKTPPPVKGKIVCSCNNVGKGNIEDEINKGVINLNDICVNTGAGSGCGSCVPEVKQILSSFKQEMVSIKN